MSNIGVVVIEFNGKRKEINNKIKISIEEEVEKKIIIIMISKSNKQNNKIYMNRSTEQQNKTTKNYNYLVLYKTCTRNYAQY